MPRDMLRPSSLEGVLNRISADANLKPGLKRELCSALNTLAVWLNRPLSQIPADHPYLRRAFDRLNQTSLDVGRGRFNNVRSLAKKALKLADVPTSGHWHQLPLAPAWQALRRLIRDSYTQESLARFIAYCSATGVSPEEVADVTVETFLRILIEEDMTSRPYVAAQSAVRLWNRQIEGEPNWPQRRLTPLVRAERYTLRWHQLLPDFVADVERYLALLAGKDPTDPLSAPRPLKPLSIRTRRYQILQFVSALHHQGIDVATLHSLADLCRVDFTRQALQFFIARHRERHGPDADVATTMIGGIADMIRCVAKHYVKAPECVVVELTRIAGRLNRRNRGMTEKNRKRLAQLDSPLALQRLLRHPRTEMEQLARKNALSRLQAVRYSVLLAIEILINAPMRSENLAELDLDNHFVWPPRRRGEVGIMIPRSAVKNEQPLSYKLSEAPGRYLYIYLDRVRPLLTTTASTALFPNHAGRSKRPDSLSKQITRLLKADLNIAWNAHLFRHLAVRIYLRGHPGDYEGARRLVAHLSGETTYRIYEGEDMRPAVDRYDRLLDEARGPFPSDCDPSRSSKRPRRQRS